MMRRFQLLVVAAILVVAAFSTGLPFLFYLLYLGHPRVGGSYVLARLGLADLEAGYAVSQLHGHVGDRLRVTYTLRNTSRHPEALARGPQPDDAARRPARPGDLASAAASERSWLVRAPLTRRGHFRIEPLHIRTGDPFGFFEASATVGQGVARRRLPADRAAAALAAAGGQPRGQPRRRPSGRSRRRRSRRPSGRTRRATASTGSTGRSTARHGEIQVKEFDLEQTADAWIFLDLQRGGPGAAAATSRRSRSASGPRRRSPTRRSPRTARSA